MRTDLLWVKIVKRIVAESEEPLAQAADLLGVQMVHRLSGQDPLSQSHLKAGVRSSSCC